MGRSNPHEGLPITDDDATIAAALEDVSIPTLMLSLVHMTGDASLIRGRLKPQGLFLNEVQGYMSEDDKAEVRRIALDVIRDYRDRGCTLPPPPSTELIHEMMSWLVCEDVPQSYVPLLLEELELDDVDSRKVELTAPQLAAVVGSGQITRGDVVSKIWAYIKKNNLQNPANKREILADDKLKAVFDGKPAVSMFEMNKHLAKHLK